MITVTAASTLDRDMAREFLWRLRVMQPQITGVWAAGSGAGLLRGPALTSWWTGQRS
ncbi:hypothetical protein [Streptomyces sp. NPDC102487]|uniref:hypothetical protein n=1 Tax=Streptomyces sp. NPDC102487 TaxID=3366182 RepID=UPI0038202E91